MRAIPAGIFDEPTPKFLMTVGKSSAVNTGIMTFDDETENLPIMARVMVNHSELLLLLSSKNEKSTAEIKNITVQVGKSI